MEYYLYQLLYFKKYWAIINWFDRYLLDPKNQIIYNTITYSEKDKLGKPIDKFRDDCAYISNTLKHFIKIYTPEDFYNIYHDNYNAIFTLLLP